jgi:hypothetical protein
LLKARSQQVIAKLKSRYAAFLSRVHQRLDAHAEKQKTGWGSSLEYKRRYTNPDDAKRQRSEAGVDRRR